MTNAAEKNVLQPTKEFPGVDIDRIHYKLGAVRIKELKEWFGVKIDIEEPA